MKLTFKYPVYPTQAQEEKLLDWLMHLKDLQNSARHDRLVAYETEGRFVSLADQQNLLTAAREKYDDFREVPQDFQNHALRRNDKAFANFRRRCKNGDAKKGYPRYKKRVRSLAWSLRKYKVRDKPKGEYKRKRENPIIETDFRHNRLKVPKLGEVKIYMHRPLIGDPKEVTLVKKASGWYAHISCEIEDTPKVETNRRNCRRYGNNPLSDDFWTVKRLTTPAGIAKQRACCENTLKHNRVGRKGATAGKKPCMHLPYTKNGRQTNVRTLSVNSSINSTTITKTMF